MTHQTCYLLFGFILGLVLGLVLSRQRQDELRVKMEDYRFYLQLIRELATEDKVKHMAREGLKK